MNVRGQLAGFVERDWRITRSYRFPFLLDALTLVAGLALYFFIGRFVTGSGFFAYALAGLMVFRMNGALTRTVLAVESEIAAGALEVTLGFPTPAWLYLVGTSLFETLRAFVYAFAMFVLARVLFGGPVHTGPVALLTVLVGLAGAAVLFLGLGGMIVAAVLVIRQGSALSALVSLGFPILSGAYFPLSALPPALEQIARYSPFRFPVEVVRAGLIDGHFPSARVALMAGSSAAMLVIGIVLLARGVGHARRVAGLSRP